MEGKHTPGPWEIFPVSSASECCDVVHGENPNIRIAISCPQEYDPGMELANARLIAAAPDLLAAATNAKRVLNNLNGEVSYEVWQDLYEPIYLLEAAIAKAQGESNG
jgi:hypothetical protein